MVHIANEMETYLRQVCGNYGRWYAGIAATPRERLFMEHSVREKGDLWIFRDCGTDAAARWVENYFLGRGCLGGPGGGDNMTRYVYLYQVGPHTREAN